jgi:hypothetical protein
MFKRIKNAIPKECLLEVGLAVGLILGIILSVVMERIVLPLSR